MKNFLRILQLNFLPVSTNVGLLVLRVWLGLSLLILHGWPKLKGFSTMSEKFPDLFGIGSPATLALAIFGEVVCAALVVIGLLTRLAALMLIITMSVAFFMVHKASLTPGPGSGELAYIYLAGWVTLFIAGAGRFSIDSKL